MNEFVTVSESRMVTAHGIFNMNDIEVEILWDRKNQYDVYYTLDGTKPSTENGLKYSEPIYFTDASNNENVYSNLTEISTNQKKYLPPIKKVDKVNILRMICVDKDSNKSGVEVDRFFFVGQNRDWDEAFGDMPVISILIEPEELFGVDGIYMVGEDVEYPIYSRKDPMYKKTASVMLFDKEDNSDFRKQVFDIRGLVSIKGASSRDNFQKSMSIEANEIYQLDECSSLEIVRNTLFCGMELWSGSTDEYTKFKDPFCNTLSKVSHLDLPQIFPCHLFLDGEYWGVYYCAEKINSAYLATKYSIDADDIIIFDDNTLKYGKETDNEERNKLVKFVCENDLSDSKNYEKIAEMIDLNNLMEYFAIEIFIHNDDWMHPDGGGVKNYAMWKSRNVVNNESGDGRWRFLLYDLNGDSVLSYSRVEDNNILYAAQNEPIFEELLKNKIFREQFAIKCMNVCNIYFEENRACELAESIQREMEDSMQLYYDRFHVGNTEATLEEYYFQISSVFLPFIFERRKYLNAQLVEILNMYVNNNNSDQNYEASDLVVVAENANDLDVKMYIGNDLINLADGSWAGTYFSNIPIELRVDVPEKVAFGGVGKLENRRNFVER